MEGESLPLQHIIDNPLNVQSDDCSAAFVGFQEKTIVGVVVEEILRQRSAAECILQDVEVAFPVRIPIRVILPKFMPGKPEPSGAIEAIGQMVTGGLATGGVAGPAAGGNG